MRTAASEAAAFAYDGRSYLRTAAETAGGSSSVEPLYDSAGVVHALRRRPSPTDPEELVVLFYLAGRPVAQLTIDGAATETWVYLTTDHLGTPLLATNDAGAVTWEGGFEPFGRDYQQGTLTGALSERRCRSDCPAQAAAGALSGSGGGTFAAECRVNGGSAAGVLAPPRS